MDCALVGAAAGSALVGEPNLETLRKALNHIGYEVHVAYDVADLPLACGVGGKVKPVGRASVPVTMCGRGVVEFLVLPHACPPLLPAKFLEFLKAKADMSMGMMSVEVGEGRRDLELRRLPSGHRAVSLVGCPPEDFKLSDELARRFPLF
eukprot:6252424-Pyramimonas_sp.AAC.1